MIFNSTVNHFQEIIMAITLLMVSVTFKIYRGSIATFTSTVSFSIYTICLNLGFCNHLYRANIVTKILLWVQLLLVIRAIINNKRSDSL